MKKYALIFTITYLFLTIILGTISEMFKIGGNGFNITATIISSFVAAWRFTKEHRRLPIPEENKSYAWLALASVWIASLFLVTAFFIFFISPTEVNTINNVLNFLNSKTSFIVIAFIGFIILSTVYYFVIQYSFSWYAKQVYNPKMSTQNPEHKIDRAISTLKASHELHYLQLSLVVLSWIVLIAAFSIKFTGIAPPTLVTSLALFGAICGFGSWIVGRNAKPIHLNAEYIKKTLNQEIAKSRENNKTPKQPKIPLTIGFANLIGSDVDSIVAEDVAALSPFFSQSKVVPHHQIPASEILLVYAHLNEDGTIKGPTSSGIRQIVQLTNSAIVILASPNSSDSIQKAIKLPGQNTANIVFTVERNGSGFSRFFQELFEKMRDGKEMLHAWVELAPQGPNVANSYLPSTILLAEGGKIAFPR